MTIAPIPPPVHKVADFHEGIYRIIMTSPEVNPESINFLDEDSLRLLYLIATEVNQITHLIEYLGLHRSTVSKKAKELEELGLVTVEIKPGTEKKYRPTKIFVLSPAISIDIIRRTAEKRGTNLDLKSEEIRLRTTAATPSEDTEHTFQPAEQNQGMDDQEQFRLQRPNNLPNLGQPLNSSSNPKLPGLPEYDPSWPEDVKRNWMKAYTILLDKASQ